MLRDVGSVEIHTKRLCLRRFVLEDADLMFQNWASSENVTRYMTWFPHQNVTETQSIIAQWTAQYQEPHCYQWAIVLKEINEPIGSIGVVQMDETVESCEIGYCIGEKFWGQGITCEALSAVIDFLFHQVGFNRIAARHDVRNPNSGKVMVKCGMQYEGTFREVGLTKEGERLTLCYYGILRGDYL